MRSRFPTFFILVLGLSALPAAAQDKLTIYTYESFTAEWGPGSQVEKAFEADCGCESGCETATPDTPFTELCAISARLTHPVAVLDESRTVVGVVPGSRLIGFLGESTPEVARA